MPSAANRSEWVGPPLRSSPHQLHTRPPRSSLASTCPRRSPPLVRELRRVEHQTSHPQAHARPERTSKSLQFAESCQAKGGSIMNSSPAALPHCGEVSRRESGRRGCPRDYFEKDSGVTNPVGTGSVFGTPSPFRERIITSTVVT